MRESLFRRAGLIATQSSPARVLVLDDIVTTGATLADGVVSVTLPAKSVVMLDIR